MTDVDLTCQPCPKHLNKPYDVCLHVWRIYQISRELHIYYVRTCMHANRLPGVGLAGVLFMYREYIRHGIVGSIVDG